MQLEANHTAQAYRHRTIQIFDRRKQFQEAIFRHRLILFEDAPHLDAAAAAPRKVQMPFLEESRRPARALRQKLCNPARWRVIITHAQTGKRSLSVTLRLVRMVKANRDFGLVFEAAFEGLQRSPRHKSGVAMRFSRIYRLRLDKPAREADELSTLEKMLGPA